MSRCGCDVLVWWVGDVWGCMLVPALGCSKEELSCPQSIPWPTRSPSAKLSGTWLLTLAWQPSPQPSAESSFLSPSTRRYLRHRMSCAPTSRTSPSTWDTQGNSSTRVRRARVLLCMLMPYGWCWGSERPVLGLQESPWTSCPSAPHHPVTERVSPPSALAAHLWLHMPGGDGKCCACRYRC